MPDQPEFTKAQRREIDRLRTQAGTVRGLQAGIVLLGAYLAIADGRGWPAFLIACCIAAWMQTQLPALPPWLDKLRPRDD